jgi:hydrogenase maturation protease
MHVRTEEQNVISAEQRESRSLFSSAPLPVNSPAPGVSTLVLGLGNPILGDDGVGWQVVEECAERITTHPQLATVVPCIEFDSHSGGGLSLAERLVGYNRVILIDAMSGGVELPGNVACFRLEELTNPGSVHTSSAHDTSLVTALELTRRLGVPVPENVIVVAVQAENLYEFSEELSPAVQTAVPEAVERVLEQLATWAPMSQGK